MKKVFMIVMILLLVVIAAACGGNSQTPANSSEKSTETAAKVEKNEEVTSSEDSVEIDVWYPWGDGNGAAIEELVAKFNNSQKEIVVKATFGGDYYENHAKLLAAIPANNQPDVSFVELASIGSFGEPGALEDLTPYAERDNMDLDNFHEGLMKNSYWDGKLVALPFFRSTPIMYMNATLLKEAGLDPSGPQTWEELREYSRELTIKDERWGFTTPIDIWFYEALVFQQGGSIMSDDGKTIEFNTKEGVAPIKFWKEMVQEGIMKAPPGEKYNAWTVADTDFFNQQVAIMFGSTGGLNGRLEKAEGIFEMSTAFLPAGPSGFAVPTGGGNIVMLSKSEKKDAAWEFIKFMVDTEQAVFGSQASGYMPVTKSAVQTPEMKKLYEETPQFKVALDQLQYGKPRPMAPAYKEMQETIMTELQRTLIDDSVTPEQAIDNAAKKGEKLLK